MDFYNKSSTILCLPRVSLWFNLFERQKTKRLVLRKKLLQMCKKFRTFLVKGVVLHLKRFESPSPKDALCKIWLKFVPWFWSRRFLNFVNVFSLFCNYLPLEMGGALHMNKIESLLSKDALCHVWLKLAQWFWRRRWKCEKFTTTTTTMTTTTDNWQILIRKAHLSLRPRWAKTWS